MRRSGAELWFSGESDLVPLERGTDRALAGLAFAWTFVVIMMAAFPTGFCPSGECSPQATKVLDQWPASLAILLVAVIGLAAVLKHFWVWAVIWPTASFTSFLILQRVVRSIEISGEQLEAFLLIPPLAWLLVAISLVGSVGCLLRRRWLWATGTLVALTAYWAAWGLYLGVGLEACRVGSPNCGELELVASVVAFVVAPLSVTAAIAPVVVALWPARFWAAPKLSAASTPDASVMADTTSSTRVQVYRAQSLSH